MNYIERVKEIRAFEQLSQDGFSEKINYPKHKLRQFEAGNTKFSIELLEALVKYCDIDANDFMGMPRPFNINEDGEDTMNFHCFGLSYTGGEIMKDFNILPRENGEYAIRGLYRFLNQLNKLPNDQDFEKAMQSFAKACVLPKK